MAFRYLIYSTGTTYTGTILRESAIDNPVVGEASLYSNFIIPEIQPLYLWQVSGGVSVIPNTDTKINLYEAATAPAPTPQDSITYGEVTGITVTKIDKVPGFTGKIPTFTAGGNLQNSGYTPAELIASGSGVTTSTFAHYTGVTVPGTYQTIAKVSYYTGTTAPATFANKAAVNYFTGTTLPANYYNKTQINYFTGTTAPGTYQTIAKVSYYTGTTAPATYKTITSVNYFTGTTLPANYYNKTQINFYTGQTNTLIGTKVTRLTGATQNDIVIFGVGGQVADSGKLFTTTVQTAGLATNGNVPTELAVRNAINSAVVAAIILQGDWNAATNVPDLTVTGITTGFAWRVSVSGTTNLGGINYWSVGDMAIKTAGGWIRTASEDIAAIWGNIRGTLSNQTDLQNALNLKLNTSIYQTYTGTTAPATFANKAAVNFYTGTTAPNTYLSKAAFSTFSGTTLPANYYNKTQINYFTGTTLPTNYYNKTQINYFTGTTLVTNYYNKSQINNYTGATNTLIGTKLNTSVFTGYTASTKNKDKKIQVVSTSTLNANVVTPFGITWGVPSVSADTYLWSVASASTVWIKSAGTYEIQYHILLKNDAANQTHSVGAYVVKNNSTTLLNTAGAGMVVGVSASGEISLPPVVQTFAVNDRLDLAVFRVGSSGNANLVSGSVFMTLNKLT